MAVCHQVVWSGCADCPGELPRASDHSPNTSKICVTVSKVKRCLENNLLQADDIPE